MLLDSIPPDKALHYMGGTLVGLVGALGARYVHLPPWECAAGLAFLAGILKEASDKIRNIRAIKAGQAPPHGVELLDAAATALGGLVVGLGTL